MKTLSLADLSQPIRDFLATVEDGPGVTSRDEQALHDLRRIQTRVGDRLRSPGVTEEEFDRAVQEGDEAELDRRQAETTNEPGK